MQLMSKRERGMSYSNIVFPQQILIHILSIPNNSGSHTHPVVKLKQTVATNFVHWYKLGRPHPIGNHCSAYMHGIMQYMQVTTRLHNISLHLFNCANLLPCPCKVYVLETMPVLFSDLQVKNNPL